MNHSLPVADTAQARRYARDLVRRYPGMFRAAVGLHVAAALAALAGPRLLGDLVEAIERQEPIAALDHLAYTIAGFAVLQAVLIRFAHLASAQLGERVLARLREEFIARVLTMPLATVEAAGTGDLLNRTTRDVDALSRCVRLAVPETMIAMITIGLVVVALLLLSPIFAIPLVVGVPGMVAGTRWCLRRAPRAYRGRSPASSPLSAGLT